MSAGMLEAWVLARVRGGERVAWLGPGGAALEQAGCAVLRDAPAEQGARARWLAEAAPAWVVLAAPAPERLGAELSAVLEAVPAARVALEVSNPLSADALLSGLVEGAVPPRGLTRRGLAEAVREAGGALVGCEPLPVAARPTALAAETERALRGVLAQLSPEVDEAGWRLVVARSRAPAPHAAAPGPGTVSVVWHVGPGMDPHRLDAAAFALACQEHAPLEVVLAGEGAREAEAALVRYAPVGEHAVRAAGGGWAEGLAACRGRYVAFLDGDCRVYPDHFSRLLAPLRDGAAAWSVGRTRRVVARGGGADELVTDKRPSPEHAHLTLEDLCATPGLACALMVDRARLGAFVLLAPGAGPEALPARLAALFEPARVEGIPSVELLDAPAAPGESADVLYALRPLSALRPAAGAGGAGAADGLRHRLLDGLNLQLKRRAPRLHGWAKTWARGWLWRTGGPGGGV